MRVALYGIHFSCDGSHKYQPPYPLCCITSMRHGYQPLIITSLKCNTCSTTPPHTDLRALRYSWTLTMKILACRSA